LAAVIAVSSAQYVYTSGYAAYPAYTGAVYTGGYAVPAYTGYTYLKK